MVTRRVAVVVIGAVLLTGCTRQADYQRGHDAGRLKGHENSQRDIERVCADYYRQEERDVIHNVDQYLNGCEEALLGR